MCLGKLAYRECFVVAHIDVATAPAVQDGRKAELLRDMEVIDAYFRRTLLELVYRHGTYTKKDAKTLT